MTAADNLGINNFNLTAVQAFLVSDSIEESSSIARTVTENTELINSTVLRVDFNHTELCTDCTPMSCTLSGGVVPATTWRESLVNLVEMFLANCNKKIRDLFGKHLLACSSRPILLKEKPNGAAKQLKTVHWLYVIAFIAEMIGKLCQYCGVNLKDVQISYAPKTYAGTVGRVIWRDNV